MRREWALEDLIECWTLDEPESGLLANKSGATRLAFALMLKFFDWRRGFPAGRMSRGRRWSLRPGRSGSTRTCLGNRGSRAARSSVTGRRPEEFYGFRELTVGDEDKLIVWLAVEMCPLELSRDRYGRRCCPVAAKRRSNRCGRRESRGCWTRQMRCSSGSSPPRAWGACLRR
jgi:hypothetical protein